MAVDNITIERIKLAHPSIREQLMQDYIECNNKVLGKGVRLRFAWVYRTPKEQNQLFAKKPKVTNAKAWQSIHNYGLAFDIVLLYDKNSDGIFEEASWDMTRDGDKDNVADWVEVAVFFKSKGYEWGGNWEKFKDYPHFQKSFGYNWKQLQYRVNNGISITDNGIIYPKL